MQSDANDIFARAHELSGEERETFLSRECGEDAELRLEVQRLLVDADKADSFFADTEGATIGADASDESYTEAEGDVIGPYTLRQQIGEGGFGTVWMAEQSVPISRMVALKVVKAGMDTRQVLVRFEAERQAVAMMDHPNTAKVLDAGATPAGRPYFAMELVKGVPITDFCKQQKFGPRQRLELFRDVCAAVSHAHQKGIIHRDLKPSNIMVTLAADVPMVKVIDFGIAKATHSKLTEKTLFTRFEQFMGTPVYMSPEQAAMSSLDIDTRSDIYSLGVLLYELLAGAPPFDAKSLLSAGYDEMRRIIAEDEPPKPSTRLTQTQAATATTTGSKGAKGKLQLSAAALRGELDWVVMKAIEKDRTRRYETANAFAADIGRYLADEPVLAGAPSATYKFKKFARRNKVAIGVAAAVVVLLLGGIAATSWQAVRATRAETQAVAAEEEAKREATRATTAEKLAKNRLTEVVAERDAKEDALADAEAISKFLTEMFVAVRPDEEKGGIDLKVTDVLDKAVEQLKANKSIPPLRRAKLQSTLGNTYRALGLARQAIPLLEKVLDYVLATSGREHPRTLRAMSFLANSYYDAGRRDEALKMHEEVLALRRKVLGLEHPETLNAMGGLAASYYTAGRRDEALKMQEEVLALLRKVNGPEHAATLFAMHNLASYYHSVGRQDEALELREEVLPLSRKVLGPEHTDTLFAMHNLAVSYYDAGRRGEALEIQEEVLALSRKINGQEHPETLQVITNLAYSYFDAGRPDEALKMREEALAISRKVLGPEHPDTLAAMSRLAASYAAACRWHEAIKLYEEELALSRKLNGPEHPKTLSAMHNLALAYSEGGRRDEALEMQEEVLALLRKVNGPEHAATLSEMSELASYYHAVGRQDEALEMREEVLALRRKVLGLEHPETLSAMHNLAVSYSKVGRRDEALEMREEVLALSRKVLGPEHPNTLSAMHNLALAYSEGGRRDEALEMREELLALSRKINGPGHPDTGRVAAALGFMLDQVSAEKNDHGKKTVAAWQEAVRINPKNANVQYFLGLKLLSLVRLEEAVSTLRAASDLYPAGPRGIEMRERLAEALLELDREAEAEEVRREIAALPGPVSESSPSVRSVIVAPISEWRWLHPTDGVDPAEGDPDFHATFFAADHDDGTWQIGKDSDGPTGGFGYGDEESGFTGVDIGTPEGGSQCAYFRHRFTTAEAHTKLELRCQHDDGIIVYLDGKEIARSNVNEGAEADDLPAAQAVSGEDETTIIRIPLQGLTLPAGEHLLAISLHNASPTSSDLRIAGITLLEIEQTPPD